MDSLIKSIMKLLQDGDVAYNWLQWCKKFKYYHEAVGGATLLVSLMYNDAEDIYESFTFGEKEVHTLEIREGQTSDAYLAELWKKSETCEFGVMRDDLIKDRYVCGIRNNTLRQRFLREHNITLIKAIDTCRTVEVTGKRLEMFQEEAAAVQEVTRDGSVAFQLCTKHERRKCPAYGAMCRKCNGRNHFAKIYKTSLLTSNSSEDDCVYHSNKKVREVTKTLPSSSEDDFVVAEVNISGPASVAPMVTSNRPSCEPKIEVMNTHFFKFKLDTGAQVNLIPLIIWGRKYPFWENATLKVLIMGELKFSNIVVEKDSSPILGLSVCVMLNLFRKSKTRDSNLVDLISMYHHCFEDIG
ncbi:hypothetical protein PR048_001611 [Dryococelus australis]|uniref:Peptidase A2 domain-containing protein n=1 Tax=Dryococelus australis TaxID=614101 RepID=A0ABQ9IHU2_9NEOP|nr:hypothetical protein PR048_001611 [Dryococelus australis]